MSNVLQPDMLFGIPLWDSTLPIDNETREVLVDTFITQSETLQGAPTYESGGWESDFTKINLVVPSTLIDKFYSRVLEHTKKVVREGYSNRHELKFNGYIAYVKKEDEYIKKHAHISKGLFISTFCLTAPESQALLTFYNGYTHITPFMETLDALDYNLTHPVVHYEPKVDRIFTYPAWLPVSMLSGKTAEPRIMIDFYFRT